MCAWPQIADELKSVVNNARQASLVHLATDALPDMPTDATAYIQVVEETAHAAAQLALDFDGLTRYVYCLQWALLAHCIAWERCTCRMF